MKRKAYQDILDKTKEAKSREEISACYRETNAAALQQKLTITEESKLAIARCAMRKALACHTYAAVDLLVEGYCIMYRKHMLCPETFFGWLLEDVRHRLWLKTHRMELKGFCRDSNGRLI